MTDLTEAIDKINDSVRLIGVLGEVSVEVFQAREKHGKQADMAFGTGPTEDYLLQLEEALGEVTIYDAPNSVVTLAAKRLEQESSRRGEPTWANVLGEEFFEALAEDDWPKLRAELIQVAAMATSWVTIGDEKNR